MPTGSNKGIKTSVKLDVTDAEKKLKLLKKRIAKIQQLVGSSGTTAGQFSRYIQKAAKDVQKLDANNQRAASSANKMASGYKSAAKQTNILTKNLRTLASTYIGIMGLKAVATASDTITKSENKLNALNGNDKVATQEAMDKMYAAAQRSRTGYGDMMQNVSKSMTLAPDAFQGDIDNAIRFQEIMGKTYALGGASAAEQSSSMYQLIQSLGAGKLQGDELRSMTEGAPLAAKAIEEYAQKIYGTTDALKDMGSEGLITSEIVVAAMMQMGEEVDAKFADTAMTFEQAWQSISNTALKSFEPVLQMLNAALNSDFGKAVISGIGYALQFLAGTLQIVFGWISNVYNFIVTNWSVISKILLTIATIIAVALIPKIVAWISHLILVVYHYAVVGAMAVASALKVAAAWIMANLPLFILLALLALLIITVIWVADSFAEACGFIVGAIAVAGAFIYNLFVGVISAIVEFLWVQFVEPVVGIIEWIVNAFGGGFDNIGDMFFNLLGQMLSALIGFAKPVASVIDAIFGTNTKGAIESAQASLRSWGKNENATTFKLETPPAMTRIAYGDAWDAGYDLGYSGGQWATDKISGLTNSLGLGAGIDSAYSVGGSYDPSETLAGIKDDTGDISDAVKLTEEDLDYLRRVADMEWKKEFTTANITVDMKNTNTINNKGDLDGWAISLRDMLSEELDAVANGVYATGR